VWRYVKGFQCSGNKGCLYTGFHAPCVRVAPFGVGCSYRWQLWTVCCSLNQDTLSRRLAVSSYEAPLCSAYIYLMPKVLVKPAGSTVRCLSSGKSKNFFFHSGRSRPALGPTQPPGHCVLGHVLLIFFLAEAHCF
jgi:hypothetical protein